jgi:hypothetical protein
MKVTYQDCSACVNRVLIEEDPVRWICKAQGFLVGNKVINCKKFKQRKSLTSGAK